MENLYLRVEDEIKVKLAKEAKSKGLSLNRYINNLLETFVMQEDIKALDEKYRLLVKDIFSIMQNQQEELLRKLNENTEIIFELRQVLE